MSQQALLHLVPYLISVAISASVGVYAWRRRAVVGAEPFTLTILFQALVTCGYILEMTSTSLEAKIFWDNMQWLGTLSIPLAFFAFAQQYTGRKFSHPERAWGMLAIISLSFALLVVTDTFHGLLHPAARIVPGEPFSALTYEFGFAAWATISFIYLLFGLGLTTLVVHLNRSQRLYRYQIRVIIAGFLLPSFGAILTLTGLIPSAGRDITLVTYPLGDLVVAWGLFRFGLLDLLPVAHDAIIEGVLDGVLVLDARRRVLELNPAMQRILGVFPQGLIGRPAEEAFASWPDLLEHLRDPIETRTEISQERGEEQSYYDLQISPLPDHRGSVSGWVLYLRDVTGRWQVDDALQEHIAALEVSNTELDAFAHTVAHDLKNPLSTVMGYAELLGSDLSAMSPQVVRKVAEAIMSSSSKAIDIVEALLLLASARRDEVQSEPLRTGVIVGDVLARLSGAIAKHQAEISVAKTWPLAVGNASLIVEVWANYVSNALKYGGMPPRVELGANRLADGMVRFWVRDNGLGLTPDEQAQLFTPFTRLHEERAEGHGLGLSIVQRIVNKLGGEVGVESKAGEGSLFFFTLPAGQGR